MYGKYNSETMKTQAFKKMISYCNYQSRGHKEVREKLYALGLWKQDVEELLSQLIEESYVNEGLYARSYAGERFKIQKWGKTKIKVQLKQRQVSDYNIKHALKTIDETIYRNNLAIHARKKWDSVKGTGANVFVKMRKTGNFLLQRGYESKLVWEILEKLKKGEG